MKFGNTSERTAIRRGGSGEGLLYPGGGVLVGRPRTKLLSFGPFNREGRAKPSSSRGGPRLNVCLNALRTFQSEPFARAHRISAWSHGRARLPLGKADTTPWLSEAELNRPCSSAEVLRRNLGEHNNPRWTDSERNMSEIPPVPTVCLVVLTHSVE